MAQWADWACFYSAIPMSMVCEHLSIQNDATLLVVQGVFTAFAVLFAGAYELLGPLHSRAQLDDPRCACRGQSQAVSSCYLLPDGRRVCCFYCGGSTLFGGAPRRFIWCLTH